MTSPPPVEWVAPAPRSLSRRTFAKLGTAVALAGSVLASSTPALAARHVRGFDEPYDEFAPSSTRLHTATPKEAGLNTAEIDAMLADLRADLLPQTSPRPLYPGAVVLVGHAGKVVVHEAMGQAVKYADADGTELPADQQVAMAPDTIFDMASVSKLFTSIAVVQQLERGRVDLDATLASYLPAFAANGKDAVTVRHLLTHTSGLPSWIPLWRAYPDRDARIQAVLSVQPSAPPAMQYVYSDLNLITLGALVELVSETRLDVVVRDGITGPLGMADTGYNPPASKLERIAATEYESDPPRGMVRGSVHDENAWSLDGVAGHAGIFSTAPDLALLAQAMLNGGSYDGHRILSRESVDAMLTDFNESFPGHAHGLGFELDQRFYMGALTSPRTAGHTGFTGTSVVIDPLSRSFVILLTNRVHPRREWSNVSPSRRAVAGRIAQALAVTPRRGPTAWFAGQRDGAIATLTLPVALRTDRSRLGFELFVDSEETDFLSLELSRDAGLTWGLLPFVVSSRGRIGRHDGTIAGFTGRHWQQAYADVGGPPGEIQIRWRYVTDPTLSGRGIYVDDIRVADDQGVLVDGERDSDRFVCDGWSEAER